MVKNYADRVRKLENMGATTSDAQAAVDAELEKEGKTKMKTKHTPGPWRVYSDGATTYVVTAGKLRESDCIATVSKGKEYRAALIAAAPDMLAALKRVAKWGEKNGTAEIQGMLSDVFQAISKAEGV